MSVETLASLCVPFGESGAGPVVGSKQWEREGLSDSGGRLATMARDDGGESPGDNSGKFQLLAAHGSSLSQPRWGRRARSRGRGRGRVSPSSCLRPRLNAGEGESRTQNLHFSVTEHQGAILVLLSGQSQSAGPPGRVEAIRRPPSVDSTASVFGLGVGRADAAPPARGRRDRELEGLGKGLGPPHVALRLSLR